MGEMRFELEEIKFEAREIRFEKVCSEVNNLSYFFDCH